MEQSKPKARRCAIYTRKSSEEGLEQHFNSLHAQRESCEAFIKSQAPEGLETHQGRIRRRRAIGRYHGAARAQAATRRYR
jgi:DNA invertase Pin-like site-specific DNA recombinase